MHGPREGIDLVVGSQGGLIKLFYEGYLKRDRVSSIALDEIDTLLDDTFKVWYIINSNRHVKYFVQDDLVSFLKKFGRSGQSIVTGVTILMAGATFPTNFDNYL